MSTSFEFQTFIHDLERSLKLYGHSKRIDHCLLSQRISLICWCAHWCT